MKLHSTCGITVIVRPIRIREQCAFRAGPVCANVCDHCSLLTQRTLIILIAGRLLVLRLVVKLIILREQFAALIVFDCHSLRRQIHQYLNRHEDVAIAVAESGAVLGAFVFD